MIDIPCRSFSHARVAFFSTLLEDLVARQDSVDALAQSEEVEDGCDCYAGVSEVRPTSVRDRRPVDTIENGQDLKSTFYAGQKSVHETR